MNGFRARTDNSPSHQDATYYQVLVGTLVAQIASRHGPEALAASPMLRKTIVEAAVTMARETFEALTPPGGAILGGELPPEGD